MFTKAIDFKSVLSLLFNSSQVEFVQQLVDLVPNRTNETLHKRGLGINVDEMGHILNVHKLV